MPLRNDKFDLSMPLRESLLDLGDPESLTLWRQEGKEDQGITFVQVRFCGYGSMYKQWGGYALFWSMLDSFKLMRCCGLCWMVFGESCACCSSVFWIFGIEYRYSSVVSVPEFNTGIRVSILLDEYRYPFEIM
ncbi:hypothetical protein GQ457_10G014460 [Hibiscus cannabinus]